VAPVVQQNSRRDEPPVLRDVCGSLVFWFDHKPV
jgi:hypothetical protein